MSTVMRGKAVNKVKTEIGYQKKPNWPVCGTCANFALERVQLNPGLPYMQDKQMHCTKFHIATGKISTCSNHEPGEPKITKVGANGEAAAQENSGTAGEKAAVAEGDNTGQAPA